MPDNFADFVLHHIQQKDSRLLLGLKPDLQRIPTWLYEEKVSEFGRNWAALSEAMTSFDRLLIEAAAPNIIGIVPRLAYYQMYGAYGIRALELTIVEALEKELIVVIDARISDYDLPVNLPGRAFIGEVPAWEGLTPSNLHVHAVTVVPYYGRPVVEAYANLCQLYGRGLFLTVNPQFSMDEYRELSSQLTGACGLSSLGLVIDVEQANNLQRYVSGNELVIFCDRSGDNVEQLVNQLKPNKRNCALFCVEDGLLCSCWKHVSEGEHEEVFQPCGEAAKLLKERINSAYADIDHE